MKVEKTLVDSLNAAIKLTIEKEDYLSTYKDKLNSYRQQAHMKGFRKGKTPMSIIKKMYGSATLQEAVSKVLSDKINEIITGDEFNIIGEPLLINEDNLPTVDHNNPAEYTYEFELGLEPEFEVEGISEADSYTKHKIDVNESLIDEEVVNIRKRLGQQESIDDVIKEDDIVQLKATELDGDNLKDSGHHSHFTVQLDKLTEKYKKQLLGAKKDLTFDANIYELEDGVTSEYVDKYLLRLSEDADRTGDMYRIEIEDVKRVQPAEFDQKLFDQYFGQDEVKSEEEARSKIKSYIEDYFDNESTNLLNRTVMEALMEKNPMELPEGFLMKWLSKEKEIKPEEFASFTQELKWRIIKKKLVKKFEVEVKEEEIFNFFVNAVKNYSPYSDEASLKNTAFSLMQNREQVNSAVENISSGKLFDAIREVIQVKEASIDKEGFYEIVKSLNHKAEITV